MPDIFESKHVSEAETPQKDSADSPRISVPTSAVEKDGEEDIAAPLSHEIPASNESHIHALASYCQHPSFLHFQGKDLTQKLTFFLRRHVITNVPWITATIGLLLIPVLALFILSHSPNSPGIPQNFLLVFLLFYYLVVLMYAFLSFLSWFYNILLVTSTEITDIDYADLVYHDLAATNVNLIEDVQYIQSGFIPGLFNFGDVYVQTAGGKENIEALSIPRPAEIAKFILTYIGKGELGG